MDRLQTCAKAFQNLLDAQYHMVLGRKGRTVELTLEFTPLDFHHLMGLGKLKDLKIAQQNREQVFLNVVSGLVSEKEVYKSQYIGQVENRFAPLSKIEELLDDNRLIFRYNEKQQPFSSIKADFLLSSPFSGNDIYIFIAEKAHSGLYFCRSFFPKESKDYTVGQPIYTLLYKEKITLSSGVKIVQYDRPFSSSAV